MAGTGALAVPLTRRTALVGAAALWLGHARAATESPALEALRRQIDAGYPDIRSVVVQRQGDVVFEYQRNGDPETLHDVQSVAKSGLSALVGVALAEGRIDSLDQPVVGFLPELASAVTDPRAARVTVRHLLTMTAGFDVNATIDGRPDLGRAAIGRPMKTTPGEAFAYDNLGYVLLGRVVQAAVGQPLAAWGQTQLLAPLGISRVQWPGEGRVLLGMRTRDMATLGQLFLADGRWGDRQLVPAEYVRAATRRQNAGGPPVGFDYGYMWWILPDAPGRAGTARRVFMASGFGGQLVWVHPEQQTVVAITSEVSAGSQSRGQSVQLLRGRLLPAMPVI